MKLSGKETPLKAANRSILLRDYIKAIAETDRLPKEDIRPVQLGLFGEVGSVLATAKKIDREGVAYQGFTETVEEEFGDVLWYFTMFCERLGIGVDDVFSQVAKGGEYADAVAASDLLDRPLAQISAVENLPPLHDVFLKLGKAVEPLIAIKSKGPDNLVGLIAFADSYLRALQVSKTSFSRVVHENIAKTTGRFLNPDLSLLPKFDEAFPDEERLPDHFEIKITQRKNGRSHLQWHGVFIGSPLTDNIRDPDGYRFHDVFHLAHAAVLHWSPTFRALIQQKRKSDPKIDEGEDGGRAIVIEEGLTAWLFSRAKMLDLFEKQNSISFDLLKTIEQFVRGYEVAACPLALWERAILQGYKVFRQVHENNGGLIIGDRLARTIEYMPIQGQGR